MALYLIELPDGSGVTRKDVYKAMVVEADSEAEAKEYAAAVFDGDSAWATATALATGAATDYEDWTYRVRVSDGPGDPDLVDVTVTGGSADDVDDIGDALVIALNATVIDNASYSTPTLTVAGAGDAIGDKTVAVEVIPPWGETPIASMVGTITDQGSSGDALTVVLEIPTAIPAVLKQV